MIESTHDILREATRLDRLLRDAPDGRDVWQRIGAVPNDGMTALALECAAYDVNFDEAPTWATELMERVGTALAPENDDDTLRAELIGVAGLALAWIAAIDRRNP
jgi:hypothetical protein